MSIHRALPRPTEHGIDRFALTAAWPVWAVLAVYLISIWACVVAAGAPFTYPLDDVYIHLSVARTLATWGVWGVQPSDPAAASSSPLWTLLLAGFDRLWPPSPSLRPVWLPLGLNILSGCALIASWHAMLERGAAWYKGPWRSAGLLAMMVLAGLTPLSLIGMEHGLHILLATAVLWLASRAAIAPRQGTGETITIGLIAALAVAARYESLFLIAPLSVIAVWRRRFVLCAALVVGAAAPVLGFGVYWSLHGGWMLPNALLIKASSPMQAAGPLSFLVSVASNFIANIAVHRVTVLCLSTASALLGYCAWLRLKANRFTLDPPAIMAAAALCATILQMVLASVGWLYRYEAWLIAIDLLSIALLAPPSLDLVDRQARRSSLVFVLLLGAMSAMAGVRSVIQTTVAVAAIDDRRQEHWPVAMLLRGVSPGQTILINDLGMASYYGRARLMDLFGLGDNEPLRLRRKGVYGEKELSGWVLQQHASAAILQVCWQEVWSRTPMSWRLVELWRIPRNVVFADRDIGFFAFDARGADALAHTLRGFNPSPRVQRFHTAPDDWPRFVQAARDGRAADAHSPICAGGAGPH